MTIIYIYLKEMKVIVNILNDILSSQFPNVKLFSVQNVTCFCKMICAVLELSFKNKFCISI